MFICSRIHVNNNKTIVVVVVIVFDYIIFIVKQTKKQITLKNKIMYMN